MGQLSSPVMVSISSQGGAQGAHDGKNVVVKEKALFLGGAQLRGVRQLVLQLPCQAVGRVRELDKALRRAELKFRPAARQGRSQGDSRSRQPRGKGADCGQDLTPRHGQGRLALNGD